MPSPAGLAQLRPCRPRPAVCSYARQQPAATSIRPRRARGGCAARERWWSRRAAARRRRTRAAGRAQPRRPLSATRSAKLVAALAPVRSRRLRSPWRSDSSPWRSCSRRACISDEPRALCSTTAAGALPRKSAFAEPRRGACDLPRRAWRAPPRSRWRSPSSSAARLALHSPTRTPATRSCGSAGRRRAVDDPAARGRKRSSGSCSRRNASLSAGVVDGAAPARRRLRRQPQLGAQRAHARSTTAISVSIRALERRDPPSSAPAADRAPGRWSRRASPRGRAAAARAPR